MKKYIAESIGTFWLVFTGCGSGIFAAGYPEFGIGFVGVSLAFGLSLLTMVYTIGPISGCHINPAVTIGLFFGGRFSGKQVLPYIFFQVLGGILGAFILFLIFLQDKETIELSNFAANGYNSHSPDGYPLTAAFMIEFVLTCMFLLVILGSTHSRANQKFAGISIGLSLVLIHLVSIPITNTSVNPARSTSQALFVGGWAMEQLWLFWVAPILGAILGGLLGNYLFFKKE